MLKISQMLNNSENKPNEITKEENINTNNPQNFKIINNEIEYIRKQIKEKSENIINTINTINNITKKKRMKT